MADLESYVSNRVVNGHCDCMFLYNTYQWPWTRIAGLIAPRPLLFANSDHDSIFPMDANERVINRLKRLYSLFGASDLAEAFVSVGGHAYRQDLRQGSFRFLNTYLKNDPRPVLDSEVDLVTGPREEVHPIPPEQLRVFPLDSDLPTDARNNSIDQEFVPMAKVDAPTENSFPRWKTDLLAKLRRLSFHHFPQRIPAALPISGSSSNYLHLQTETGIEVRLRQVQAPSGPPERVVLVLASSNASAAPPLSLKKFIREHDAVYVCETRGVGLEQWTSRNPPNYVERAHYLLGRTVDSGRIWDIAATGRYLRALPKEPTPVVVMAEGAQAVLAVYAALLEPDIDNLVLREPPSTHMDRSAPALLNVLRVCDLPEALGMLAPRPVTLITDGEWIGKVRSIYRSAGAKVRLTTEQ